MIHSMTGFGLGETEVNGTSSTVELRSVNNRFCEVSVRLPRSLSEYESEVQARIKKNFTRGRITAHIQVETARDQLASLQINPEGVRHSMELLNELRETAGLTEPIRLKHLLRYSDIFQTTEVSPEETAQGWDASEQALDKAIANLQAMRRLEGDALLQDMKQRLQAIDLLLEQAETHAPKRVEDARERLRQRVADMLEDNRIDPHRLELEIAILADRLDVTEECVRLKSHLNLFQKCLASEHAEGRKLNFIAQEIHREVNTLGSKSGDTEISYLAVAMKDELEKIREQVQNVE